LKFYFYSGNILSFAASKRKNQRKVTTLSYFLLLPSKESNKEKSPLHEIP